MNRDEYLDYVEERSKRSRCFTNTLKAFFTGGLICMLGQAFAKALGDKGGICRFGSFFVPMDEALAFASVDISGRPFLVFQGEFPEERVGDFDTCMTEEFFRALAFNAGMTLHLRVEYGKNSHHMIEALFKAAAHALREATALSGGGVLSTKGIL